MNLKISPSCPFHPGYAHATHVEDVLKLQDLEAPLGFFEVL
jgi:hypothetical protein